jgi:hypothetical protein
MDDTFTVINSAIDSKLFLISPTVLQEWVEIKTHYPDQLLDIEKNIEQLNDIVREEYFHKIQPKYLKIVGRGTQYELDEEKFVQRFKEIMEADNKKFREEFLKDFPHDLKKSKT